MRPPTTRAAARRCSTGSTRLDVVYTQTWQYDDPADRLCDRLGVDPKRRHYSGIGGTTPQLLRAAARGAHPRQRARRRDGRGRRGARDAAEVQGAWRALPVLVQARGEAPVPVGGAVPPGRGRARGVPGLADVRDLRQRPPGAPRDPARRVPRATWASSGSASRGSRPRTRRRGSRSQRSTDEIITPTASNRMVGYPYTKYMVSIMDVDMAGALVLDEPRGGGRARRAGGPSGVPAGLVLRDRPGLRGRAPRVVALARRWYAGRRPRSRMAGVGIDDVAHLDLYSCFGRR